MKRSATRILKGSNGAMLGPTMAQNTISRTRLSPSKPSGSLAKRRSTRDQVPGTAAGRATGAEISASEGCADTGIQPGNDEVGDRHREREQRHRGQRRALYQGIVAQIGGIDDQLADTGAGEDILGEDRARQQPADRQREQGDGR